MNMSSGTTNQKRKRGADISASEALLDASDRDTAPKPHKKSRQDAQNEPATSGGADGASTEPKKRGRPRKSVDAAPPPSPPNTDSSAPKKRGRPRKSLDAEPGTEVNPQKAPEPKKAGRPRKNLDTPPKDATATEAETSMPKKRGRPAKPREGEDEADNEAEESRPSKRAKPTGGEDEVQAPNKRARSGKAVDNPSQHTAATSNGNGEPSNPAARRSQRDRRSADDNPWWSSKDNQAPETSEQPDQQRRTKQGKQGGQKPQAPTNDKPGKGKTVAKPVSEPAVQKPSSTTEASVSEKRATKATKQKATEDSGSRRSTRDRRSADENAWWASQTGGPSQSNSQPQKGPGRPSKGAGPSRSSLAEVSVSEMQNKSGEDHKGKEAKKTGEPQQEATATGSKATKSSKNIPGKGAGRPYAGAPDEGRRTSGAEPANQGRRRSGQGNETVADTPAAPIPKYRHLTSRIRQIPRATITAKWSPLDDGAIAAIDGIISNCSLPVLSRFRDRQQRHQQAQTIVRAFGKRLHSKLLKGMPFPPPSSNARGAGGAAGHELELDFEKTVDAIQSLEKTLDPLLHSVALLEAEREREEAALEKEYKDLQTLETNAKAELRDWRERGKREHVLAPGPRAQDGQVLVSPAKTIGTASASGVFSDLKEKDLVTLSQQIGNHMESMRSNLQQIDGVLPAIVQSRAALQGVLHRYLDPVQYDQAVLG